MPFFKDSGHCPKILDYTLFAPCASLKLLNFNQVNPPPPSPHKRVFFWPNPCKIDVMITSYTNARVTTLWSNDHIHNIIWVIWQNFVDVIDRIYDVIIFNSKYLYFKKDWGSYFCWHHQNFNHVFYNNLKRLKKS